MIAPSAAGLTLAGHQPHYFPWLGYIDKISTVDVFCQVDVIAFEERLFQHRNRIRAWNAAGEEWLVVPVVQGNDDGLIMDVEIDNTVAWREAHWKSIRTSYAKAPYFSLYEPFFAGVYAKEWHRLVDLNEYMLRGILGFLNIGTQVVRASALDVRSAEGNLLVRLCRKLGAATYVSGAGGGCAYLDEGALETAGIAHRLHRFTHPVYPQLHGEFMPRLAVPDLLFNCGPDSAKFFRR